MKLPHPSTHSARPLFLRVAACFLACALAPFAGAQGVVSSGLTGTVRDTNGKPVANATVNAVHTPTGTAYSATSTESGRYNFRGLVVGGPYTVSVTAGGFKGVERTDVMTALGQDVDVPFVLEPSSVVVMEKFMVKDQVLALDAGAMGAASLLDRDRLLLQPTAQRSFADLARTNAMVTLRNVFGDRQEGMLAAVGTNNRFNSVMLDGARINDQFGLNASGLQSFFNPLSIETVEQFSISVSPFDVRQSGFTGAAVNAVTRSGTNQFKGSLYGYYSDQKYAAKDLVGGTAGTRPFDERRTWGATLGGPILKNRLFFFGNYEKFHREQTAPTPGLTPSTTDLTAINNAINAIKTASGKSFDQGTFGGAGVIVTEEEKKLYKLDWNITKDHRLSVRYNETVGTLPQFGRYSVFGSFANPILSAAIPTTSAGTVLSSNFYAQIRTEEVYAGTLNSQWTPDFKTEFKYAKTSYEQLTTNPVVLPEVRIMGVSGINSAGANITNGVLAWGMEQFRHGNIIRVNTESYSGNADYFWKNFTFTGGFDREESDFFNLFRASSYGIFDYASVADFVADRPAAFSRAFYVQGTPAADLSSFSNTGVFGQAKWEITPRLTLTGGIRTDLVDSPTRPPLNQALVTALGVRNDGNIDGVQTFSPRVAFNWAVDSERSMQLRGGLGHFVGRAPWVFISNAYGNSGVGRFSITQSSILGAPNNTPPTLTNYLRNTFDPANPIGVAPTDGDPTARRGIALLQDGLKLPSVWRGSLAVDRKVPGIGINVSAEAVFTRTDKSFFTDNMNIKPLVVTATSGPAVGLDGRQRFNGASNSAGAASTLFNEVIRVRNIGDGRTAYYSLTIDRPMKNNWAYNLSYTTGRSREAQSFGQTVALDGWSRNAVFNQNSIEVARSDFEIRHRLQTSVSRQFEWAKGWKMKTSLYYEGRSGNPYSYTYNNDVNGDGVTTNDLVYVPTGPTDPKISLAGMNSAQQAAYFDFLATSGLNKFAGTFAPRNAFIQPWINQLDLKITQRIPIYQPVEVEIFMDFVNFGFWLSRQYFGDVKLLTNTNNAVYYRRIMGNATYNANGQLVPTYTAAPAGVVIDNNASRWRVQFGATVRF
ncbi:MAG: TonB-dependent receptor [Verrucomicrobia bacterium]|nr:TonB-dependent receptor [Verrucomicrobiota bacterium]